MFLTPCLSGQKAPSTRRCIKTFLLGRDSDRIGVRKYPAAEDLFTGLAVRWLPTAPENGQSDRQSLEQDLRVAPNHPATTGAVLLDNNQGLHPRWIRAKWARRIPASITQPKRLHRRDRPAAVKPGGRAKEPSRPLITHSRDTVNASVDQHPCPTPGGLFTASVKDAVTSQMPAPASPANKPPALLRQRRRGRTMMPPKERLPTPAFNL